MKSVKTLLAIEVYELTGEEIEKLESKSDKRANVFDLLPEFCIHNANGKVAKTSDYLYWGAAKGEKYTLFSIDTADKLLDREICDAGFPFLMEEITNFTDHIKDFKRWGCDDLGRLITRAEYLVVHLVYDYHDSPDGREHTMTVELGEKLDI